MLNVDSYQYGYADWRFITDLIWEGMDAIGAICVVCGPVCKYVVDGGQFQVAVQWRLATKSRTDHGDPALQRRRHGAKTIYLTAGNTICVENGYDEIMVSICPLGRQYHLTVTSLKHVLSARHSHPSDAIRLHPSC